MKPAGGGGGKSKRKGKQQTEVIRPDDEEPTFSEPSPPPPMIVADCSGTRIDDINSVWRRFPQANYLLLASAHLDDRHLDAMAKSGRMPYLQALDLSNNGLTAASAKVLASLLALKPEGGKTGCSLTSLNISNNPLLTDQGGELISAALHHNFSLTELNCSGCRFGKGTAVAMGSALEMNSTLLKLHIQNNRFLEHSVAIAKSLMVNNTLQVLTLAHCQIGDVGGNAIKEALIFGLKSSSHGDSDPSRLVSIDSCSLLELNLSYNTLTKSCTGIAKSLKINNTLTHLDLSMNNVSILCLRRLREAFEHNTTLQTLILSNAVVEADTVGTILYELFGTPSSEITPQRPGDSGLFANRSLTALDLSQNSFNERHLPALIELIKRNSALTSLNLSHAAFTNEDALKMDAALRSSPSCKLTTINLMSNLLDDADIEGRLCPSFQYTKSVVPRPPPKEPPKPSPALTELQTVAPRADAPSEVEQHTRTYFDTEHNILGCEHYQVNCKIRAPCCGLLFTCRLCHDNHPSIDHALDRKQISRVWCMMCEKEQDIAKQCSSKKCNGKAFAHYYCPVCHLLDNDERKDVYHCVHCGVCRLGKGLEIDTTHCFDCNKCFRTTQGHDCTMGKKKPKDDEDKAAAEEGGDALALPAKTDDDDDGEEEPSPGLAGRLGSVLGRLKFWSTAAAEEEKKKQQQKKRRPKIGESVERSVSKLEEQLENLEASKRAQTWEEIVRKMVAPNELDLAYAVEGRAPLSFKQVFLRSRALEKMIVNLFNHPSHTAEATQKDYDLFVAVLFQTTMGGKQNHEEIVAGFEHLMELFEDTQPSAAVVDLLASAVATYKLHWDNKDGLSAITCIDKETQDHADALQAVEGEIQKLRSEIDQDEPQLADLRTLAALVEAMDDRVKFSKKLLSALDFKRSVLDTMNPKEVDEAVGSKVKKVRKDAENIGASLHQQTVVWRSKRQKYIHKWEETVAKRNRMMAAAVSKNNGQVLLTDDQGRHLQELYVRKRDLEGELKLLDVIITRMEGRQSARDEEQRKVTAQFHTIFKDIETKENELKSDIARQEKAILHLDNVMAFITTVQSHLSDYLLSQRDRTALIERYWVFMHLHLTHKRDQMEMYKNRMIALLAHQGRLQLSHSQLVQMGLADGAEKKSRELEENELEVHATVDRARKVAEDTVSLRAVISQTLDRSRKDVLAKLSPLIVEIDKIGVDIDKLVKAKRTKRARDLAVRPTDLTSVSVMDHSTTREA